MKDFIQTTFINRFNNFMIETDKIISDNSNFKKEQQLYHYTSLETIENIIKSQSIRASNIFLMNDPNELIYGQESITNEFNQKLSIKLKHTYNQQSINTVSAFVFSLSELSDDMNQWEKYGNKHKGIRVGFTPKNLLEYWCKIDNISVFLVPVIYQDSQSKYLSSYGDTFSKFKNEFISAINNYYIDKEINNLELNKLKFFCSLISSMIKRKEWSSEKEWRIICISNGAYHKNINGSFSNGKSNIFLENKTSDTLKILTNNGHDGIARKDILKLGCNAGNKEQISYILSLLYNKELIMTVSQSNIQTR